MLNNIRLFSVAVADLDQAVERYQNLFGLEVMSPVHETQFGFKAAILGNGERSFVELISPVDPESPLSRFMRERSYASNPNGEGVYVLNIEVDNLEEAVQRVKDQGGRVTQVGDRSNAAWVHPTSTNFAFIELVQAQ